MNSSPQNSILRFPDVVSAHIFGFLSTSELGIFGGANTKTHKNTRVATFLRATYSTIQERPAFKVLKEGWKEHRTLKGIVSKLCDKRGKNPAWNEWLPEIADTSSLESFNYSIRWLRDGYEDDEHWAMSIVPGSNRNGCVWTEDERKYVDQWLLEYDEYYKDLHDYDLVTL